MSKKSIEKKIPKAIDVIKEYICPKHTKGLPKEFKGYISSFGASVIQSGLIPSVAFFENTDAKSQADREILMKAILFVIKDYSSYNGRENEKLLDYIIENQSKGIDIKNEIIDASVALKLALRTFKFASEGDAENGNS